MLLYQDHLNIDPIPINPLVSIITMVRNGIKYLEPCLQSVLLQTYPNIEHIIVDGASSDGTVEFLTGYAERHPERIRFISEPDKGSGDAWNKGIKMARGDILGWIGADDLYELDAVEAVVDFFRRTPEAFFVYGGLHHINEKGDVISTLPAEEVIPYELINSHCVVPTPSSFYRPEVIKEIGFFDELGNDLDFFMKVIKKFKMYKLDKMLSSWRHNPGSVNTGSNWEIRLMWKREDCLVSRRHGAKFFSGYCKRYYMVLLYVRLRPILGPIYPLMKKILHMFTTGKRSGATITK